jgi:thiol:disulfide interchange protein
MKHSAADSIVCAGFAAVLSAGGTDVPGAAIAVEAPLAPTAAPARAAPRKPIYPGAAQASADIAAGLRSAVQQKKRVLVAFGANWCGDCVVLDENLHRPENLALLKDNYVLVLVNVGEERIDHNVELAQRYGIPLDKGVPALAVLDHHGLVVYSQKNGEFEPMRSLDPESVHEFLLRWRK